MIAMASAAVVLVLAIAGVFLFYPKNQAPEAPASIGNTAAPKPLDPQDYLNQPATAPDSGKRNEGDIIVIYGEKPQTLPALGEAPAAAGSTGVETTQEPGALTVTATATATVNQTPAPEAPASKSLTTGTGPAAAKTSPGTVTSPGPTPSAKTNPPSRTTTPSKTVAPATKQPATVTEFWIQAASFTERAKADSLREALAAKGIAGLIAVKDINGTSWYRVRIGPWTDKKEADGWLGRVKSVPGCAEAFVSSQVASKP
jgi:DedD protein